jgi:uncharacterized membrane protein
MLPRALIGDVKPENWLGFIDAIYAIILTLLLIELPAEILDLIREYEQHPNFHWILVNSFALSFFGYLGVFVIVYDIWAHHRVLVAEAALNRVNLSLGILMLFLSSLLPPLYHVLSAIKHQSLIGQHGLADQNSAVFFDARLSLYVLAFCVNGCIALIATKDLRFFRRLEGVAHSRLIALKRLKESSIAMLFVIAVVGLLSSADFISPPVPIVLIALCTHLPVDRLMLRLKRKILPY